MVKNLDKIIIQIISVIASIIYAYYLFYVWTYDKEEIIYFYIGLLIIIAFTISHLIHTIITWRK